MKIGILTLRMGHNYGGILQNWALQQVLKDMGHEPISIVHQGFPRKVKFKRDIRAIISYAVKHVLLLPTRHQVKLPWDLRPYTKLKCFIKRYIKKTEYIDDITVETLKKYHIDLLIVGSDQVWRPMYCGSSLPRQNFTKWV